MRERINTGRQGELDVAKALAIPYMVIIHVYEELSVVDYDVRPDSLFRGVLEFLGGPLAAPVFMFAMGVGMVYTRHRNPRAFALRGLRLLLIGYLLNLAVWGSQYLLSVLQGHPWYGWSWVDSICMVDILQFAGMSFLLMALLTRLKVGRYGVVAVALLLQALGTLLLHRFDALPGVARYAVGLVFYTSPNVYFPLSLWFVYPAVGVLFGEFLQTVSDKRKMYNRLALGSAAGLVAVSLVMVLTGWNLLDNFALADDIYYVQRFPVSLWTLLVVGLQLFLCYRISLGLHGWLQKKTGAVARRLNVIYIVQWLVIASVSIGMDLAGLPDVPVWAIVPVGLLIAALSIAISLNTRYARRALP